MLYTFFRLLILAMLPSQSLTFYSQNKKNIFKLNLIKYLPIESFISFELVAEAADEEIGRHQISKKAIKSCPISKARTDLDTSTIFSSGGFPSLMD